MAQMTVFASCRIMLMVGFLAAINPAQSQTAGSSAIQILLSRAKAQAQSGHLDIAVSTWQQVLSADPVNLEALKSIATAETELGHQTEANAYIVRLQKAGASKETIGQLQGVHSRPSNADLLDQAAALAKTGRYDSAMVIYRQLYGDNPPAGNIALVYYDTLAALPSERKQAIEGLRKLVHQFPAQERYAIALGRVLTYDASTRAGGMALLQQYPKDHSADDAFKQATVWEERAQPTRSAATASSQAAAPATAIANRSELGAGFRSLNGGDLAAAAEHFQRAIDHEATHGQAHAGLGYVRMRQQNFGAAVQEFEQAKTDGDHDANLAQALLNSQFWKAMDEGRIALDRADLESAVVGYRSALALKPESVDALNALGGALLRRGQPKEAIPYLERALKAQAGLASAWRALFFAQSQASEQGNAVRTAERIPQSLRVTLDTDPEFLGQLASDYAAIGEQAQSDATLKHALTLFQGGEDHESSIAAQMQYAALLSTVKRYTAASRIYRHVLTKEPANGEAWRGVIATYHLAGGDAEALRAFHLMPPSVYESLRKDTGFLSMLAAIYQSQEQIEAARAALDQALKVAPTPALELQLASLELSDGDKSYATKLYAQLVEDDPKLTEAWLGWIRALHATGHDHDALRQIDEMPEEVNELLVSNPEYLQSIASVYTATGEKIRAAEAMTQVEDLYAQQGIDPPAGIQLQQGWLFLQWGENARLSRTIQGLSRVGDLTEEQQTQLAHLWASWAIQKASQQSRLGNRTAAVAILDAGLRAFPDDVSVNNALANAYLANGDAKGSVLLYARQDMNQAEASVCVAAINAAIAANDRKLAKSWLEIALSRFERDPKVLDLAARFEQQRGDQQRAAAYERAALQAAGPLSIAELTSATTDTSVDQTQSARQELLGILAPANALPPSNQRSRISSDSNENIEPKLHVRSNPTRSNGVNSQPQSYLPRQVPPQPSLSSIPKYPRQQSELGQPDSSATYDSYGHHESEIPGLTKERLFTREPVQSPKNGDANEEHTSQPSGDPASDLSASVVDIRPVPDISLPVRSLHGSTGLQGADLSPKNLDSFVADSRIEPISDGSYGVVYQNAALKRAISHGSESALLSDTPATVAVLQPLPSEPIEPLPPLTGAVYVVRPPLTPREQMQQNLDDIESGASSYAGGASSISFHSGQPGLDRLTAFSADIEQSVMFSKGVRATILTHPILLQSGLMTATSTFQLGTLPLGDVSGIQTASGVGGELQLRTRSIGAAVGYTPRGFLVQNVTGRFLIQPDHGPVTLSFERQPIEDTQLSYAGLRDFGSATNSAPGNIWGGVISNAGSLLVNRSEAASGWYMQGGGQYITGYHVAVNYRLDGYAGAYWSIWDHAQYGKLTLGMNFFGMHYANNQRLFTYGNGGYFSPGAYLLSAVPVTFEGHYGTRFHYRLAGSLGLQAFEEDASPYFPIDSALQATAKNPFSVERISVGANYNVEGQGSYLITEHWHVGASFNLNNSYDYTSDRLSFFLRYAFFPQSVETSTGPTGLETVRGLRPLSLR